MKSLPESEAGALSFYFGLARATGRADGFVTRLHLGKCIVVTAPGLRRKAKEVTSGAEKARWLHVIYSEAATPTLAYNEPDRTQLGPRSSKLEGLPLA